jgi:hypothetical protein
MSADRETKHDMATARDIALLLAEAADEVEIGIAPYQAVVRGGRRRKARRWALAAAAALVIAGSTGTLALAGAVGNDGRRVAPAVTVEGRHVYAPQVSTLAMGTDHGRNWQVGVAEWEAPKNKTEAERQLRRMKDVGVEPAGARGPADMVGKGWFFVTLRVGEGLPRMVMEGAVEKGDGMSGKDVVSGAMALEPPGPSTSKAPQRLVIGKVAPTARQVTCTWDDGTTSVAGKGLEGDGLLEYREPKILPVAGSGPHWFVCLAPEGKGFKSVAVTK